MEENEQILARIDLTDEMRIQFAIDEFYEFMKQYDGSRDKLVKARLMRNNILNMMDTYLKKFQNDLIMQDFYKRLNEATNNGASSKYSQYMNEIRVIQEFKGIEENMADKLAEQFYENCINIGEDLNGSENDS